MAGAGPVARGAQIMIGNPSFEQPNNLGAGGSTATMPNWSLIGPEGSQGIFVNDNQNGMFGAVLRNVDGNQLAYVNASGNARNGGNGFYQELTTNYAAGMSYTLTAAVAESPNARPDAGNLMVQLLYYDQANSMSVVAASTTIAFNNNRLQNGSLVDFTATLANGNGAMNGRPITVNIVADGNATRGIWDVDNIRLTSANANPEPASLVIASEAALVLLGVRWLRRSGRWPRFLNRARGPQPRPADPRT
jgi:hypothetical protein